MYQGSKNIFYITPDQNSHLSPPKIWAKVAYIYRKSDLRAENNICGSKVKFVGQK